MRFDGRGATMCSPPPHPPTAARTKIEATAARPRLSMSTIHLQKQCYCSGQPELLPCSCERPATLATMTDVLTRTTRMKRKRRGFVLLLSRTTVRFGEPKHQRAISKKDHGPPGGAASPRGVRVNPRRHPRGPRSPLPSVWPALGQPGVSYFGAPTAKTFVGELPQIPRRFIEAVVV